MSDWIGPNIYRIESYIDRKATVSARDGSNVVLKQVPSQKRDAL